MAHSMNETRLSRPGLAAIVAAVVALAAIAAGPLAAIGGQNGDFTWAWDNSLSYGLLWRISNPDDAIVGLAAGGKAYSVNGDDGNQNYGKGDVERLFAWAADPKIPVPLFLHLDETLFEEACHQHVIVELYAGCVVELVLRR